MPRLLRVLRGRRSWQGHVGCHRRPLEEDRVRRLRFALCTAASAPFLPWRRRKHTHAGFLRSHRPAGVAYMRVRVEPVPAGARPMRRTSTSPPSPSRISDLDYAPSSASPATCPGSFLGLLGRTERSRSWVLCSCARAGTLLPAPHSRGTRVCAMLRLESPTAPRACAPPCSPGPRSGRHARILLEAEQPQQGSEPLKRA